MKVVCKQRWAMEMRLRTTFGTRFCHCSQRATIVVSGTWVSSGSYLIGVLLCDLCKNYKKYT